MSNKAVLAWLLADRPAVPEILAIWRHFLLAHEKVHTSRHIVLIFFVSEVKERVTFCQATSPA